jgi:hypothetical protein
MESQLTKHPQQILGLQGSIIQKSVKKKYSGYPHIFLTTKAFAAALLTIGLSSSANCVNKLDDVLTNSNIKRVIQ